MLTTLAAGCGTLRPALSGQAVTTEMLLEARPIVGNVTLQPLPDTAVLALDQEMLDFLDRYVAPKRIDHLKLHELVYAIMSDESFKLEYDSQTRTAAETFHDRRGNCLSFTNMFVAMARQIGLDARFQEVDVPPDWTVAGGSFVLNHHINVLVELRTSGKRVVDFNNEDFQTDYSRRQVPDRRAMAHYYNNVGVERMHDGKTVEALQYFLKAIDTDRHFNPSWSNLGTLYHRNGHLAYAEAAYLKAMVGRSGKTVAMSNLVRLYESLGDDKRANLYQRRVNAHRMRNPYYRYQEGRQAFLAGDYDAAIGHLKSAVRMERNEHRFYYLLGLSYLNRGDTKAARRSLSQAVEVSPVDSLKRDYQNKIDRLFSTGRTTQLDEMAGPIQAHDQTRAGFDIAGSG